MKFNIKTNLWSGIIMGALSLILLVLLPNQVRVPAYDSGAPSPRIIPGICLVVMLIFSIVLIIYVALILVIGFIPASIITFFIVLAYCGERKPFIYIVIAAATVGIYFLFKYIFTVSLPTGMFF